MINKKSTPVFELFVNTNGSIQFTVYKNLNSSFK